MDEILLPPQATTKLLTAAVRLWSSRAVKQLTQSARRAGSSGGLACGRQRGPDVGTRYVPGRRDAGWIQLLVIHPVVGRLLAAVVVLDQAAPTHARAAAAHTWREDRRFTGQCASDTKIRKRMPPTGSNQLSGNTSALQRLAHQWTIVLIAIFYYPFEY